MIQNYFLHRCGGFDIRDPSQCRSRGRSRIINNPWVDVKRECDKIARGQRACGFNERAGAGTTTVTAPVVVVRGEEVCGGDGGDGVDWQQQGNDFWT